jgi:hypothetical protein
MNPVHITQFSFTKILSHDLVNIYGVWIGNWIYWILTDPWLQMIMTVSLIHTLHNCTYVSLLSLLCLVTAANGGLSPSSGFPNYFCAPTSSFSQQQLTTTVPQRFSNWLTHQLTHSIPLTASLFTNFCTDCTENTVHLLLFMDPCLVTVV